MNASDEKASEEDQELKLHDVTLNYQDRGSGDIPIIFIHGFPVDKSQWEPQLSILQKYTRVIAYDVRGFGKSGSTDEPLSIDLLADDLIQVMNALNVPSAIICGLSMGGYIALNAVNRFRSRICALILCDTNCDADTDDIKEARLEAIRRIEIHGIETYCESFLRKAFSLEAISDNKRSIQAMRRVIMATPATSIINTLRALMDRADTSPTLGSIRVPTLILCGQEDTISGPKKSESLFAGIKGSTMYVFDGVGHFPNLELPHAFNSQLSSFHNHVKQHRDSPEEVYDKEFQHHDLIKFS